jgi:hypothetical protein
MKLFSKWKRALSNFRSSRRWGQAIAEFALMLPVLLTILFVLIEGALVIQGYLTVQYAAREAARWAVTYRPVQGQTIDDAYCLGTSSLGTRVEDFLGNDSAHICYEREQDAEYHARRVALIKETALQRAAGLRIDQDYLALSEALYSAASGEPGFFGVRVSGEEWDGEATRITQDHPGLPGLQVQVEVVHRVMLVDPFLQIIAPNGVRVTGRSNMINEGVQVWHPSPTPFVGTPGVYTPPPTPILPDTATPTGPPATSTPPPTGYNIDILFDYVTNTLPFERGHLVEVLVTDNSFTPVPLPDVLVSFSTSAGAYDYSGVEDPDNQYAEDLTNGAGIARQRIYANDSVVADLRAWIDLDGDDSWDFGEVFDTARKEWFRPEGVPYIVPSSYEVSPLEVITVDIYDHPPEATYTLRWCRTTITGGVESVSITTGIDVDVGGDSLDLPMEIPEASVGYYRLETHVGSPGVCTPPGSPPETCNATACSAEIHILPLPPDLHIADIFYPESYGDVVPSNEDIPFNIQVDNLSAWAVEANELFDVDLYIDPPVTPTLGQIGNEKQWMAGIDAYGTEVISIPASLGPGIRQVWAQVDTTNYIEEQIETNNIFGPFEVEVECTVDSTEYGDDFNDDLFDDKWSTAEIGSGVNGSVTESGGELQINALGSSIWGNSDNFYFVYQRVSGNFDVRLRAVSPPDNTGAKLGVMVRNSTSASSRHVTLAVRDPDGGRLQFAYREQDGGNTNYAGNELAPAPSLPVWLRIVRNGAEFSYYYSDAEEPRIDDWTFRTSITVAMDDEVLVGIAHAKYSSSGSPFTSRSDEFLVCQGTGDLPDYDAPGLSECTQLLQVNGFEGNPATVSEYWDEGETGPATARTGYQQYRGAFSMRLHSSLGGNFPVCDVLDPWISQVVEIPVIAPELLTVTHITLEGYRISGGSLADCSVYNSIDEDDQLYAQLQDGAGNPSALLWPSTGGEPTPPEQWESFSVDFTDDVDLESLGGRDVTVRFYGIHDADEYGTWFYLDEVECNVCKEWPIPAVEPGTASFGGLVRGMTGAVPEVLTGVRVVAYSYGGQVHRTLSIHDGTYHFYNVPPGTYIIYAQAWVGGYLLVDSSSVTVVTNERNYNVPLLLQ